MSMTGNTFHGWVILVKQKFWVRVLVVLWCISLLEVDDLVEDETNETITVINVKKWGRVLEGFDQEHNVIEFI